MNDLVGGDGFGQPELPRDRCSWLLPGYLTRTTTDVSGRPETGAVNSQEHKLPTNRVRSLRTEKRGHDWQTEPVTPESWTITRRRSTIDTFAPIGPTCSGAGAADRRGAGIAEKLLYATMAYAASGRTSLSLATWSRCWTWRRAGGAGADRAVSGWVRPQLGAVV